MNRANDIEEQAARWIIRLHEQPTDDVRAEFDAWASSDLRHRAAFLRLSAAWSTTDRLRTLRRPTGPIDADLLRRRPAPSRWLRTTVALAASIVVATVGVVLWRTTRPVSEVYRTAIGGYSRIVLVDGSTIALNTDSEVRVRLARDLRSITLVRGEALFDVAHDTRRPFDVHAGSSIIRAVGTSFDVRRHGADRVEVVVTEGKVSVRQDSATDAPSARPPTELAIVAAGEAARTGAVGVEVRKLDRKDAARHLAWQTGELSFQGESLDDVIAEFNRYNRRQLRLSDPSLSALRVGGSFKATDVDSFVGALGTSFGVVAVAGADGTLLLRRSGAQSVSARESSLQIQ